MEVNGILGKEAEGRENNFEESKGNQPQRKTRRKISPDLFTPRTKDKGRLINDPSPIYMNTQPSTLEKRMEPSQGEILIEGNIPVYS